MKIDFVGKRYWFFLLSLIVILPGVVFFIIAPGLKLGIDFTGGSTLTVQFKDDVKQEDLRGQMGTLGYTEAAVQNLGDKTFFIRTRELNDEQRESLVRDLKTNLSPNGADLLSFDLVSPVVAGETVVKGLYAVLGATAGIFFYVWWAFRNVPSPFRYGVAAIVALIHDVVVVIGVFAVLGAVMGTEVNAMFLIALLTVIGWSVNDTIVVFDRLRENVVNYPNRTLTENVNVSIGETISRSLNTSLTLTLTLLALFLFGGQTIRTFLLVMLIGVVAGTYSSIGIAAQLLVVWENGDVMKLFRRRRSAQRPAATAAG